MRNYFISAAFGVLLFSAAPFAIAQTYGECAYGEATYNSGCTPSSGGGHIIKRSTPVTTSGTQTTITTVATSSPAFSFSRDLELGVTGLDVQALQKFLNASGYAVAVSGAGSAGLETTYFGPATQAALAKYQAANSIAPAIGYFGPKTRAYISGSASIPTQVQTQPISSTTSAVFTRDLEMGAEGEDVRALQQYLNAHGFTVAASGGGSVGNETTYFGPATQAALAKLQAANGIAPAAGRFGPTTRAFVLAH